MAEEFTVRLRLPGEIQKGDTIEVKAKIKHPSRTGLKLNQEAENPFERFLRKEMAQFVRLVEVYYGDDLVSKFELNSSTSDDPLLGFKLRADREAPVRVVVTNHRQESVEATADVRFG